MGRLRADKDAVRIEHIEQRLALAKELGVGGEADIAGDAAARKHAGHGGLDAMVRPYGNGALDDDDQLRAHGQVACHILGGGLDPAGVGLAVLAGRRTHGDERHACAGQDFGEVRGVGHPRRDLGHGQQFGEARFVDRHAAGAEQRHAGRVLLDDTHFVSEIGERRAAVEAHIAGADNDNSHKTLPSTAVSTGA